MYSCQAFSRFVGAIALVLIVGANATPVWAQAPPQGQGSEQHQHTAAAPDPEHEGPDMPMAREGSGTGWLPDTTPMYAIHWQRGAWQLMAHENAFLQFLHESGDRGADQFGSINWIMGMAQRNAGPGRVQVSGMFSAEPWTIRGCGYPDLLASGERCNGEQIHDQQHPHDLVMEVSARYSAPLTGSIRWQVYAAAAGEPALGPVAYPHRLSAMANPLAPISHHWLDSTHITFGVVTAGVYGSRWKTEASMFNGREPDDKRTNLEFGALDSISGRVWFLPTPNWAFQVSAGRLTEAEQSENGGPGIDVTRATASGTYHSAFRANSIWATTVAWGRNSESGHASNALLLESNLTFDDRHTWFGRFEVTGKSAHDLAVGESPDSFAVAKLQGGYTRYLEAWNGLQPGIGGSVSAGIVPDRLQALYGSRVNVGFGVFLTLRPAAMTTSHGAHGKTSAPVDHSHMPMPTRPQPSNPTPAPAPASPATPPSDQAAEPRLPVREAERVIDPACATTIDLRNAPRATFQGKVYYFCSTADRNEFVKDPVDYLKKRGT
jgi:YHS domain-containing protein